MNCIIQCDSHDKNMFLLKHRCPGSKYFMLDAIFHVDCLQDLVDDKTFDALKSLTPNEMLGVEFTLTLMEG